MSPQPDAILTYAAWHSDLLSQVASTYGLLYNIPVTCLIHDDPRALWPDRELSQKQLSAQLFFSQNHRNWFASAELAKDLGTGGHAGVLTPIPEGWSPSPHPGWQPSWSQRLPLFYAGYLWPQQAEYLATLAPLLQNADAELHLMVQPSAHASDLALADLATLHPQLPTNREALQYLAHQAAGLIVSYAETVEALPWSRSSMPSKLIEYSQLGRPIALIAPRDTAVMQWARENGAEDCFEPQDTEGLGAWLKALRTEAGWNRHAQVWTRFAKSVWNPEHIHHELESNLLR